MPNVSRQDGFSLTEMMVSTAVVLMVLAGALTTFKNALAINDSAAQMADSNQNLRAGTNQLVRDLLMAGRIIGAGGVSMPTGVGITYLRPGPTSLNFNMISDQDSTLQLPSISTGYQLGPMINNSRTDIITIMTVDEFMPVVTTPVTTVGSPAQATISADATSIQFAATSQWIDGDLVADTQKIKVGDLVLYVGQNGSAIQTVTSIDTINHRLNFASGDAVNDFFHFNQPNATTGATRPLAWLKEPAAAALAGNVAWQVAPSSTPVTLFKAMMITYYVDNTTTPGTPRLTRVLNHFPPQALAGVVEDLDLTYDLYDGVVNPTAVQSLPYTLNGVTYTESQIRKVNIHVGVRSESISKPTNDYVRNHITTSVNVRSLAAVDRYPS
jgi:prepilin-type N-terminal cleavage/methylation domain-containing protein